MSDNLNLPSYLKRAKYIRSTGAQYIDIGYIPNQDTRVYTICKLELTGGTTQGLFGVRESGSSKTFQFVTSDGYYRSDYGDSTNKFSTETFSYYKFFVDKNKNITNINDKYNVTQNYSSFECPGNMYIFATNNNGEVYGYANATIYMMKIWDNDVLVRNLIPCYDSNLEEYCLYDLENRTAYYNEGTGNFIGSLYCEKAGDLTVSTSIKAYVGDTLTEMIVVHQGNPDTNMYDESCDGTWIMPKNCFNNRKWSNSNVNDYANSDINSYLNNEFFESLSVTLQNVIKQVKIPYRPGEGTSKTVSYLSDGLSCKVFLLSARETGCPEESSYHIAPYYEGQKLDLFTSEDNSRIFNFNGSPCDWWLRSPDCENSTHAIRIKPEGYADANNSNNNSFYLLPCFIVDKNTPIVDYNTYYSFDMTCTLLRRNYPEPKPRKSYTLTLTGIATYGFEMSTVTNPDSNIYDGVYRSTNYQKNSTQAAMRIDFTGYDVFNIYIRSYAESTYDYAIASTLDASSYPTTYSATTAKANTRGNQKSGTAISNYTKVSYENDGGDHHIYISYVKDGSSHSGDDRGYVLIEK